MVRGPKEDRMFTDFSASIPPFIADEEWIPAAPSTGISDEAVASIVRLDATAGKVLAPLTSFLLRNEAQSSSKIEQVVTTQVDLARAMLNIKASESARSTVAAAEAISTLIQSASDGDPADPSSLCASHLSLMKDDPHDAHYAGTFRDLQNWIGGSDYSPRGAVHVPPEPARVLALMDDLRKFCQRDDVPVLAQAAIAHAQFESIHPFTDGNGRVGRALINAILRSRGLTRTAVIPLASAFAARREWYFSLVNSYRAGKAGLFVDYLSRCAIVACHEAEESAELLSKMPPRWREAADSRRGSTADRLVDDLLGVPLLTIETVVHRLGVSRTAATTAIARLEDAGVLVQVGRGQRNQAWAAEDVLDETESLVQRIEADRDRLLTPQIADHLRHEGLLGPLTG